MLFGNVRVPLYIDCLERKKNCKFVAKVVLFHYFCNIFVYTM